MQHVECIIFVNLDNHNCVKRGDHIYEASTLELSICCDNRSLWLGDLSLGNSSN